MKFEDYWENYGELHASMCGGNIKQFAKEIWMSANVNTEELKEAAFALVQRLELDKDVKKNNWWLNVIMIAADTKRVVTLPGQLEEKKTGGPSNHIGTVMSKPNHTR